MVRTRATTKALIIGALSICIAGTVVVSAIFGGSASIAHKTKVILGNTEIAVSIADTPKLREQGLSLRQGLSNNEGMLFLFSDSGRYGFWMKEMLFPIDIIWLNKSKEIVFVKEHAEPNSYPEVFMPNKPAQFVLEVPAGFFALHHLKVGDTLEMNR
jgi:hypothetical protein